MRVSISMEMIVLFHNILDEVKENKAIVSKDVNDVAKVDLDYDFIRVGFFKKNIVQELILENVKKTLNL